MSRRSQGWREDLQAALGLECASLFRFSDAASAAEFQEKLASRVSDGTRRRFHPRFICGLDASYSNGRGIGVAAVWDLEKTEAVEVRSAEREVDVEYFSGLFGFREGPLVLAAEGNLTVEPDVFLVDGHGRSHPRRFGLACHVGLALGKPTVGVAKRALFGQRSGADLLGPDGSVLARILSPDGKRTCYVSVGHLIGLEDAFALVVRCLKGGRVVPLEIAHSESVRLAKGDCC